MSGRAEERLEAAIRAVLVESRPVTDAPADLRARVERVPETAQPRLLPSPVRAPLMALVRVAGLAAAVIAVLVLARLTIPYGPLASPPAGAGAPTPQGFDPAITGPGVLSGVNQLLAYVPWLVAFLGWVAVGLGARWLARRVRRSVALIVVIGLALSVTLGAGASSLANHPGFAFGGVFGPRLGLDASAEPPPGSDSRPVWYVTVPKGDPFAFGLTIRNPGPLPLRFLGVVEPHEPGVLFYRWSAVWQYDDSNGFMPGIEDSSAFHPIDVAPGDHLALYVVARASACAFGPGFLDEDPATFGFQSRETIEIVYSVLGLTATSELELPMIVAEPVRDSCPG